MYQRNKLETIGDKLYAIVDYTRGELFAQGKMAQLTYQAFDWYVKSIQNSDDEEIIVSYPIGYKPSKETMLTERKFTKDEIKEEYQYLGLTQLPINGIFKLVTLIESMLLEILKAVVLKYPKKLGSKKQIDIATILSSDSILEVQLKVINKLLNELAYKSPEEFVKEFENITTINLFETPVSHRYKEIKATRDIYIHNMGIVNEIYIKKADSHARAKINYNLPIDVQYFLESYEYCLQLCEFLEIKLHEVWPSQKYEEANKKTASD